MSSEAICLPPIWQSLQPSRLPFNKCTLSAWSLTPPQASSETPYTFNPHTIRTLQLFFPLLVLGEPPKISITSSNRHQCVPRLTMLSFHKMRPTRCLLYYLRDLLCSQWTKPSSFNWDERKYVFWSVLQRTGSMSTLGSSIVDLGYEESGYNEYMNLTITPHGIRLSLYTK